MPWRNKGYSDFNRDIRWIALGLIAVAEVLTLSVWFSASVVSSSFQRLWHLNTIEVAMLTAAVQIGFVIGALGSSFTGLADRFNPRVVFAISAATGALVNALFVFSNSFGLGILLRLLVGITMVGVYPVAIKLVTQWSPLGRGAAIGTLVGALTLGSSLPNLIRYFGIGAPWQIVILTSSGLALCGSAIVGLLLPTRPNIPLNTVTSISSAHFRSVTKNNLAMLANYGYFGHMWELYAMWTWFPTFIYGSLIASGHRIEAGSDSALIGFLTIGVTGAIGSVLGGKLGDKIGRTVLASFAMAISGLCAIFIGLAYGGSIWIIVVLGTLWGFSVIADSAQFTAAVTELTAPEHLGTAVTFQTALGFFITAVSINLVAVFKNLVGWHWAFTLLSIGPFLGVYSMLRLRIQLRSHGIADGLK